MFGFLYLEFFKVFLLSGRLSTRAITVSFGAFDLQILARAGFI